MVQQQQGFPMYVLTSMWMMESNPCTQWWPPQGQASVNMVCASYFTLSQHSHLANFAPLLVTWPLVFWRENIVPTWNVFACLFLTYLLFKTLLDNRVRDGNLRFSYLHSTNSSCLAWKGNYWVKRSWRFKKAFLTHLYHLCSYPVIVQQRIFTW